MSMQTSMFAAYVDAFFKKTVGKVTEYFNGKKEESGFLYEQMLDEEYSADLTWNSTSLNHSIVAADVVSMDSSLPLKKRGTIRTASGDIAKIGIKFMMKEKTISDVTVMRSKGQKASDIAAKILNNVPRAIKGVKIRIEILFERALSTGVVLFENDEQNDGTGVRASFGYANFFHALAAAWSDAANATPLNDLRQLFDAANANSDSIEYVMLSEQAFNYMRKCVDVKELVATANNQVIVNSSTLPQPSRAKTLEALKDEFGAEFRIVNNSYKWEDEAGNQQTIKPWEQGNVVAIPALKVGRLVHGTLAEDLNRVAGVTYEKSGFILVSEYSHNEPSLAEFTSAQALAFPVIDDGQSIYVLHSDGTGVISTDVDKLTFTAAANNTGKKVKVTHADKAWTAAIPAADSWATATVSGNEITVKVSANNGSGAAKRTTTLTITDADGNTKTVEIEQAA
jgi:hypothetical protein